MSKSKPSGENDRKLFLQNALAAEQQVLAVQLDLSATSITHDGVMGEVNEQHFIQFLRNHLPKRYQVDRGIVIDSNGVTSDQIDIVIFDQQYTPPLLDQQSHRFIPAESVYGVFEVKPAINKGYLEYAADKAKSVRVLERTSVPVTYVAGSYSAKKLFPILAGIVAIRTDWTEGLASESFIDNLANLTGERSLDCGLSMSDRAFDTYSGKLTVSNTTGALAWFLFRLLGKLQSLGTVPAVDWNRYGDVLGNKPNDG
jgi:hypothetical protein